MGELKVETTAEGRDTPRAKVASQNRGRPLADLVADMERSNPALVGEKGLSSAAMRAGDLVRTMRKEAELTQSELAARLGISQARISEIEAGIGSQGPTWDMMERISSACGKVLSTVAAA
jgi:DNA-binding XRE family transcriptional regulator